MVNGNVRNSRRFGQTQIDRNAAPPLVVSLARSPKRDAPTCWTEMKFDRLAANVRLGRSMDMNALTLVVICPQHTVAATNCAIARSGRLRHAVEAPLHTAAVAGAFHHWCIRCHR